MKKELNLSLRYCNPAKPINLSLSVYLAAIFSVFLMMSNLSANVTLSDIYYKDYELINRTVIAVSELPNYDIIEQRNNRKIIVNIEDTQRASGVPVLIRTDASPVLESISTEKTANNTLAVTITTRQPVFLEHFYLMGEPGKIVLDIFTKKEPANAQEREVFFNFFQTVGYHQRANSLRLQTGETTNQASSTQEPTRIEPITLKSNNPSQPGNSTSQANSQITDNLITLSKSVSFTDAVTIFRSLFRLYENKDVIDLTELNQPIGFDIDKVYWRAAFDSIMKNKGISIDVHSGSYVLQKEAVKLTEEQVKSLDNVLIEVTFFEADLNVVKELGIDWSSIVDGRIRLNADVRGTNQITQDLLTISTGGSFQRGTTTIDINTLFKAISASDKGHIISRPQITVLSGETGSVQDGIDYTILVPGKTETGEATAHEVNVQSGTIVNVTPVVVRDSDNDKAINLIIRVERSSAQPDVTGFSKKTAEVLSQKVLYNGEETVIGGLITKETVYVRKGIPVLKDLPWWVLGIRYLTGYNRSQFYNKELIILIKATVLPSLEERKRIRREVAEDIEHQRRQLHEKEAILVP